MIERRHDLCFGHEARRTVAALGKDARQDLQCDVAGEMLVARAVDVTHAAGANPLADHIRSETTAGKVVVCRQQIGSDFTRWRLEKGGHSRLDREQ